MFNVAVRDRNAFFRHGITCLVQEISTASTENIYFCRKDNFAEVDIFFVEVYNMESYNYVQCLLAQKKCILIISTENLTLARLFIKNRERVILSDKRHSLTKFIKTIKEAVRLCNLLSSKEVMEIKQEIKTSLFTPVELYVIESLKDGLRIVDIAARLNISIKTVYSHKYIARRRVGAIKDHSLVDFVSKKKKEDVTVYCFLF